MSERVSSTDMRRPGERFCADCPDHEGCATGYPCDLVRAVDASRDTTTFEEWHVEGEPGSGYPTYRFTWTTDPDSYGCPCSDPESTARSFIEAIGEWDDGPHLYRRTVTRTSWEPPARAATATPTQPDDDEEPAT